MRQAIEEKAVRRLEHQRLGLLDLRQLLHLCQHVLGHDTVDFDQCDGVAALRDAAEVEGGDIELGIAEQAGKGADEAGLPDRLEAVREARLA